MLHPWVNEDECINTFHKLAQKRFQIDVNSRKQKGRKNQIMKLKAIANVHFVYMTSFSFLT